MPVTEGLRTIITELETNLADYQTATQVDLDAIRVAIAALEPTTPAEAAAIVAAIGVVDTSINDCCLELSGQLTQIQSLIANYVIPLEENIFNAINGLYAVTSGNTTPLPQVISTTPLTNPGSPLHCQRAQWFVDYFFNTWMNNLANAVSAVGVTGAGVAVTAVILATEGLGAIPIALLSTATGAMVATLGSGVTGISSEATPARKTLLKNALYNASSPQAAQAAWNSTIDSMSGVNVLYRTVWKSLIWSNWFNDLYNATAHNATTEPGKWDLSGYSGSACVAVVPAIGGVYNSTPNYMSRYNQDVQSINFGGNGQSVWNSGENSNAPIFLPGPLDNWKIEWVSGGLFQFIMFDGSPFPHVDSLSSTNPGPYFIPANYCNAGIVFNGVSGSPGDAFSLRLTPYP